MRGIILLALLTGCGGAYTVDVKPITVNPMQVQVSGSFTLDQLSNAFLNKCKHDLPNADESTLNLCSVTYLGDLLNNLK